MLAPTPVGYTAPECSEEAHRMARGLSSPSGRHQSYPSSSVDPATEGCPARGGLRARVDSAAARRPGRHRKNVAIGGKSRLRGSHR